MWWLRDLEMLKDKVEFGIHPGKLILNLSYSVLEPLNSLPLLLEARVTLSTERTHQGFRQPKQKLFLYFLGKGPNRGWHSCSTAWPSMGVYFLIPCSRCRGG